MGTITAVAAIMVLVFGAFVIGGQRVIELFAIGLAGAVLLDALIIRSVLVPALTIKLKEADWRLQIHLDRLLPHLRVQGAIVRAAVTLTPPERVLAEPSAS